MINLLDDKNLTINQKEIVPKQCYYNTYILARDNYKYFKKHNAKVIVGYLEYKDTKQMLIRNCYIKMDDKIFDTATLYLKNKPTKYITSTEFDLDEYIADIEKEIVIALSSGKNLSLEYIKKRTRENDIKLFKLYGNYPKEHIELFAGSDILFKKPTLY